MGTLMKLTILIVALALMITEARHIKARVNEYEKYEIEDHNSKSPAPEYSDRVVDIMKAMMTPYRFAPLNRDYVFKMDVPCQEEGFLRDAMGICREVWD